MDQWQQIFSLAKIELKVSAVNLLLCWLLVSFFGTLIFFEVGMQYHQGNSGIQYDVGFCVLFGYAPIWFRAKHFQYNKLTHNLWASPTLLMQSQLPIPKDILVRSRLVIYLAYFVPATCTIFTASYLISADLRTLLSPFAYLAFAIIWLSIGFCYGIIVAASDVGDLITTKLMLLYGVVMAVIFTGIFLFFYTVLGQGPISYSLILVEQHAFISVAICLLLIIFSWLFWPRYMKRTIQKLDYF